MNRSCRASLLKRAALLLSLSGTLPLPLRAQVDSTASSTVIPVRRQNAWGEAVDYYVYDLYGNDGIAPPDDMWGNRHYGCVPGHDCYFTTSYWYSQFSWFFESRLMGEGWGLDVFFHPRHNDWEWSSAHYYSVQPLWEMEASTISEVGGWH
jgi:hypothetical protein